MKKLFIIICIFFITNFSYAHGSGGGGASSAGGGHGGATMGGGGSSTPNDYTEWQWKIHPDKMRAQANAKCEKYKQDLKRCEHSSSCSAGENPCDNILIR